MSMREAKRPVATSNAPGIVDLSVPRAVRARDVASKAYRLRGTRNHALGDALFSDPAWDMLLDLFIAACDGRRLSVTDVCVGARCATATALRYLQLMLEDGLVLRAPDRTDGRRVHVLLPQGTIDKLLDVFDR